MSTLSCDVAVIGAGTAGIAAERNARQRGARTLLIDDRFAGTTCATVGCMPSKLLIAAADAAHAVRRAAIFGIKAPHPVIDGIAVMRRVRHERDRFAASVKASLDTLPEGIRVQARAHFLNATTLQLEDGRQVTARAVVIATGSAAHVPEAFDAVRDCILTNETIFEMADLPRSVAVIGAGALGLELAQALVRLGVETRVFDETTQLSGIPDKTVAQDFLAILEKELPITLGVKLEATPEGGGARLTWSGASDGSSHYDRVLLAAGRPPTLAGLDLQATGIALNDHGVPKYDPATLQCDGSSLFIAGDADHDRPVLHEASAEGTIAGRNAASYPTVSAVERFVPLSIMFTDPPVAIVGKVPQPGDPDVVMGCMSYHDQGRAKVFARNAGLVHLYAARDGGRLIGATMAGPAIEHTAHLVAWAIRQKMTATHLLDMPFYHPTYEEGLKPALQSICHAVHAPPEAGDGPPPGA